MRQVYRLRCAARTLAFTHSLVWPSPSPNRVGTLYPGFRSSILCLHFPLSTLNPCPCEQRPMTRGPGGSLHLSGQRTSTSNLLPISLGALGVWFVVAPPGSAGLGRLICSIFHDNSQLSICKHSPDHRNLLALHKC